MAKFDDLLNRDVLDLVGECINEEGTKYKVGDIVWVEGKKGKILKGRKMAYHYNYNNKASKTYEAIFYVVKLDNGQIGEVPEDEIKIDTMAYIKDNRK